MSMKWFKIAIYLLILYGICHQQFYFSSLAKEVKPDKRVVRLSSYLTSRGSPLAPKALFFVKTADTYKLDYRLIPSIAGVESGFETQGNLTDFNAFGIMCSGSPCVFDSYEQAISFAAKTISRDRAYAQFRRSGSFLDLASVYCQGDNQKWSDTLEFFKLRVSTI